MYFRPFERAVATAAFAVGAAISTYAFDAGVAPAFAAVFGYAFAAFTLK